ncbi:MAG: lytic transglycosylase domain-containing protein [Ruminococcaceae bacterium]|nr:lytic transglycosylase domain-containing protein [Oscillospiraceae bacterium]
MKKKLVLVFILILAVLWFFFYGGKKILLGYFYPIKYEESVEKYAEEYELDKYLVYAIIKTESKFDEKAVSDAGAVGLMQIMEDTAKECNDKGNFGYNIPDMLSEPDVNIRLGCYYFSELVKQFDENTDLAIMAYNAGPENVEKWRKNPEFYDGSGGLKSTPFEETNQYLEKVMKNYERYKEIY